MEAIAIAKKRKERMQPREMVRQVALLRKRLLTSLANSKSGDLLPSENELARRYTFSRATIRNLYRQLQQEGIVKSLQGKGILLTDKFKSEDSNIHKYDLSIAIVAFIQHDHPESKFSSASLILSNFDAQAAKYRSKSKLYNLWPEQGISLSMLELIKSDNPDGILFHYAACCSDDDIRTLKLLNIPLVVSGYESENVDCVIFDHEQIAEVAAEHLLERGHRRFAFIQRSDCEFFWQQERLAGIEKVMLKSGAECKYFQIDSVPPNKNACEKLRKEIVPTLLDENITGVVCSGDIFATTLIDILKDYKVSVPEDLAIVGIDDWWELRHYDLTTVQLTQGRLGIAAFDFLADNIHREASVPSMRRIPCPLIIRSTT